MYRRSIGLAVGAFLSFSGAANAATAFSFSTNGPDGLMGVLSRPESPGLDEHEIGDDFILPTETLLTSATFTGLMTNGGTPGQVRVEIYRVFPLDSTSPPSGNVPVRTNSPSDVEFADRDTATNNLHFTTTTLAASFNVANSVVNGIHPSPNQTTQGEGPVAGAEVEFSTTFDTPFDLPAGHYFFVPQVQTVGAGSEFLWLSAPKPIIPPGTPLAVDLQTWTRNTALDPDWLRVGTDIVGPINGVTPTFNAAFTLSGTAVPVPTSLKLGGPLLLLLSGCLVLRSRQRRTA